MVVAVEFWFDFISPFAYLAWTQLSTFAAHNECKFVYRPVLFAGLLDHWGQLGPVEIEPKRLHTHKQVLRKARAMGIDFEVPVAHPFNSLLALRIACAAQELEQTTIIDTLFRGVWAGGPGIWSASQVESLLTQAGLDSAQLIARASDQDVKDRLRDYGNEAIARGVFGVPTFVVGEELFWGFDDLGNLANYLVNKDLLRPQERERIHALSAQSKRPRKAN